MARTDDPTIARMETRAVRLGQSLDALEMALFRLGQIGRRARYLRELVDVATGDINEARTAILLEKQDTERERNG